MRRPLGMTLDNDDVEDNSRRAVAFAFGAAHAWERFTVCPAAHVDLDGVACFTCNETIV